MEVGIEAINVYGGPTFLDVRTLFDAIGLDLERFDYLMMKKKIVELPCEDPNCRIVMLEGQTRVFCTWMDFEAF